MEAFTDRRIKEIVFVTCAQAGKTINVIVVPLAYTVAQEPGAALLIQPTEPNARSFSESRLQPVFNNCEAVAELKPEDSDKYKLLEMHFARSSVFLCGSNSPANLAQRPIRYVFGDEVDKYPAATSREADALELALERIKAKAGAKAVLTSTPTILEGNIWVRWDYSDQRHFMVTCPHCGHQQKPIMGLKEEYEYFSSVVLPPRGTRADDYYRLRWPKDCAISELPDRAWLSCENPECIGKMYDAEIKKALREAEWKATKDSLGVGGFHLNCFGLPWINLGETAATFLRTKKYPDKLKNFYNSWAAIPWDPVAQGTTTINTTRLLTSDEEGTANGYLLNTCPPEAIFLTAGIDVQAHEVWYVIRGWGLDEWSGLISFGCIPVETDDVEAFIKVVDEIMNRDYGRPVLLGGIDSGWGVRTAEVYMIARAVARLVCTKGRRSNLTRAADGKDIPIPKPVRIDKMPDGKPVAKGPLLYTPSTSYWKRWLIARVNGEPPRWHWPAHMKDSKEGKMYFRHLESEKEITKKNPATGRYQTIFAVQRGYEANHLLDSEVIAAVCQEIIMTAGKQRLNMEQMKELTEALQAQIKELQAQASASSNEDDVPRRPQRKRRPPKHHDI